ncbi:MAG: DUF1705 domain-containing protein [Bacteroidales bacterium]|nr:DUF1705 domain-containing protein [Bacteroidales bacterium]
MKAFFPKKVSLTVFSLVLSLYTLLAFHFPFFRHASQQVESGWSGTVILVSLVLLLGLLNFFFYYLLAWLGRMVGRILISLTLVGDAIMLYFVNNYDVLVTDEMMGNVFRTQMSEASGFFSFSFIIYIVCLGFLPSVYVLGRKVDYGSWKRFLSWIGGAIGAVLLVAFGNMSSWPWIDKNSTELGSMLMPWSYVVNTFRYYDGERKKNVQEIPLPDATFADDEPQVLVLMIGESARRDHFSYYGYERNTNPYTASDGLTALVADSYTTYTAGSLKAILEYQPTGDLYEILPNYLYRHGVDVTWRTSNWGEPPVHIGKYEKVGDLKARYPEADDRYDGILLAGLKEEIQASIAPKVLVVLHTNTSHGPAYNTKYPPEFETFTPVCNTVEMAKTDRQQLLNAYDNSIVYTDWLMHGVIDILREIPERRSALIYVSDHGESLGENGLYMHGVPISMAPKEQIEIPFLVWTSDELTVKALEKVGQHHVFHSVMRFFGMTSPIYNPDLDIFE